MPYTIHYLRMTELSPTTTVLSNWYDTM